MATPIPIQSQPPIVGGLASVVERLPEGADWHDGIILTGVPLGDTFAWSRCWDGYVAGEDAAITEKPENGVGEQVRFGSAVIGTTVTCTVGGTQSAIGDIITQTAAETLNRKQWGDLARILHGGVDGGGIKTLTVDENGDPVANPSLSSELEVPDGFDPLQSHTLLEALTYLLTTVCSCFGTDPVLHVPRQFMGHFLTNGLVVFDPASGSFRLGPHKISFDCYPNVGTPAGEAASPTALDGSQFWIYATTTPLVGLDDVDAVEVLTRRQNKATGRVERGAIIVFDTTCVFGVRVTV